MSEESKMQRKEMKHKQIIDDFLELKEKWNCI